jgi:hypothetical protein
MVGSGRASSEPFRTTYPRVSSTSKPRPCSRAWRAEALWVGPASPTLSQGERRLRADLGFAVAKKLTLRPIAVHTLVEQDETLLAAYAARLQAAVKPMSRSGGSKTRVR